MSIKAMQWVFDLRLEPRDLAVLIALADWADNEGYCYPGHDAILNRVNISASTLYRTLTRLEEAGYLRRQARQRIKGRGRTSDEYWLLMQDQPVNLTEWSDDQSVKTDTTNRSTVTDIEEPSVEPSERTTDVVLYAREECTFDDFWAVYPRREAKAAARKAWESATKRALPTVVIAGATRYRDDPNRESKYTAHPSTWLNQDRWEDDPLPSRIDRRVSRDEQNLAEYHRLYGGHSEPAGRLQTLDARRDEGWSNPFGTVGRDVG